MRNIVLKRQSIRERLDVNCEYIKITGLRTGIWIRDLQSTSRKRYRLKQFPVIIQMENFLSQLSSISSGDTSLDLEVEDVFLIVLYTFLILPYAGILTLCKGLHTHSYFFTQYKLSFVKHCDNNMT
jgi:hypothetical protein